MKYAAEFVKRVVETVLSFKCSAREAERLLNVSRKTVTRWVKRALGELLYWFCRAAKRVRNRTPEALLARMRELLTRGLSAVMVWLALRKAVCLRTVQRWKHKWFPPVKTKVEVRRYERRKIGSLAHSDWGVKRIQDGKRCCFTFYEDDATRRVYACRAYSKASLPNTLDALNRACTQTRFKAVLTDCGRVYTKAFGEECRTLGVKSIHTRPFNPKCNGKAEAVVKKIKRFLNKFEVRDLAHANRLLARFEREYNRTPHGSLKYLTPLEVYRIKQTNGDISAVT